MQNNITQSTTDTPQLPALVSQPWKQNWSGDWSLLTCSYLGYQYTQQLREVLGVSLHETLFISHDGLSACYFTNDAKKQFGEHLAVKATANPELIGQWAADLRQTTMRALEVIRELMTKEVSQPNFEQFLQAMYDYGVPHRVVKVVVDYLKPEVLAQYLDVLAEARVFAEPVYEETENYMRYMAGLIGQESGLEPHLILATTRTQFGQYFSEQALPAQMMLEEQYQNAVLSVVEGREELYTDETALAIERAISQPESTQEIRGQVAFPGRVQGRVRILLDPSQATTFNEGDILVTGMTRPDFLPFVKKAAGFITDSGGILSHAAITARELQKPCLIGTEIATKQLSDGQMIELDADQGVIRLLS